MPEARNETPSYGGGGVGTGIDHRQIGPYAAAVASGAPTPGGGSVGGLVAALAAALGEMVCALSAGKPGGGAGDALAEAAARLAALRAAALAAAEADERAYAAYRAAADLAKETDEERAARRGAMHAALVGATDVPLALAERCADVLVALLAVAESGTPHALSDARLGGYLAHAALRGALLNVRGNAALLRDPEAAARYREAADRLERSGRERAAAVEAAAALRAGPG